MSSHSWHQHYPENVPKEIDPDRYPSIVGLLDEIFEKYTDLPAFKNMDKILSYGQIDSMSTSFAAWLQNSGLRKGDRIAIQMPNLLQYPVVLFGALKAGLIVVNTNPLYTGREMEHQFKDSGAKAIVILANFAYNLEKILPKTDIKIVIITEIGDLLGGFRGMLVNFVVKNIKKMVPKYYLNDAYKLKDVLRKGGRLSFTKPEIRSSDIAFLQYTGGTTGVSKGAALSHRNLCANIIQSKDWFGIQSNEVVITALPMYHIFALTVNCFLMSSLGAFNILITNPRDMKSFCKDLKKNPFSIITGVNTLYNGLLHQPGFKDLDFSKLKLAVAGGMALQKSVAQHWKEVTGVEILEGYGLSETSPILTANSQANNRVGSIGVPVPSTDIKIMNDNGEEVPNGEPGEICAKGPQVFQGYWQRPEETTASFHGEWFKTGDIGVMNEDGFIKIVDRKKDMILVSGFNVYPNEIEEVVAAHPKVLEVAVIGVPDEKSTEAVKLFVVKKDSNLTEHELSLYCSENMTNYKRPKYIEFKDELPKSTVGKILRRLLKEDAK